MFPFPCYRMDEDGEEPEGWLDTEQANDEQIAEYIAFLQRYANVARKEIDGLRKYLDFRAERANRLHALSEEDASARAV
jgi:hypothetical protein